MDKSSGGKDGKAMKGERKEIKARSVGSMKALERGEGRHAFRFTTVMLRIWKSVIPRSVAYGAVGGALACLFSVIEREFEYNIVSIASLDGDTRFYSAYSFALGFLVVWRNSHAFHRWWDGMSTLVMAMSEWMDACSQLIATTGRSTMGREEVRSFHHVVTRLFSLMTCLALKHVAIMDNEDFAVLNIEGLDDDSRQILWSFEGDPGQMLTIVQQWILNTIHRGIDEGIVVSPPPIVSRVFQELANGTFHIEKLVVISSARVPDTYMVMIKTLLYTHIIYTSLIASHLIDQRLYLFFTVFFSVFVFWCINLIAEEIEQPFGDDMNDIDVRYTQREVNSHLRTLLNLNARHFPTCQSLDTMNRLADEDMSSVDIFDPVVEEQNSREQLSRTMTHSGSMTHKSSIRSSTGSCSPSTGSCALDSKKSQEVNALEKDTDHGLEFLESPESTPKDVGAHSASPLVSSTLGAHTPAVTPRIDLLSQMPEVNVASANFDTKWWRELALEVKQNVSDILQQLVRHGPGVALHLTQQAQMLKEMERMCRHLQQDDTMLMSKASPRIYENQGIHHNGSVTDCSATKACIFPVIRPGLLDNDTGSQN